MMMGGAAVGASDARTPLLGPGRREAAADSIWDMLPGLLSVVVFGYVATVFATVMPLWSYKWGAIGPVAGAALESVSLLGAVLGMYAFGAEADRSPETEALVSLASRAAGLCAVCGFASAAFPGAWVEAGVEKGGSGIFASAAGWILLLTRAGSGFGGGGLFTLGAALEHRRRPGADLNVGVVSIGISFGSVLVYALGAAFLAIFGAHDVEPQWRPTGCDANVFDVTSTCL